MKVALGANLEVQVFLISAVGVVPSSTLYGSLVSGDVRQITPISHVSNIYNQLTINYRCTINTQSPSYYFLNGVILASNFGWMKVDEKFMPVGC